jgi:UDP-N-acetylglucosamine--N-acetylmuramyl-(pentapeptide) pyrophosphoryl-undecaprenol N-acetylglucosamine transferase
MKTRTTMQQPDPLRIIIAGGGTGGHVFPAIAIAKAIQKKVYNSRILFVGAAGRMEMKKVPEAGFHIIGLKISGLQRRLTWKNLTIPYKLVQTIIASRNIIKRFKPDLVIGVGGYASGPLLWAATQLKIPVLIQEQNSYPGLTNRLLAKRAEKICVAYDGMERFFPKAKIYLTGNPIRQDVVNIDGKQQQALKFFQLSAGKPVLLATGGSLGARTINESMLENLKLFLFNNVQVIWQTGSGFYNTALEQTQGMEKFGLHVCEFIDRMDLAYAAADVIVSRAGAIAVSEICAVQKPAILIPSPNVAEDHQTKNALALANHHAAILLPDMQAKEQLGAMVMELIFDEDKKHRLKEKLVGLTFRDAADIIAGVALSIVRH